MFKLNFKIALRNLFKHKDYTFINISGLAIGLASCMLLLLYVAYEWNYDKQSNKAANIYQVLLNTENAHGGIAATGTITPNTIAPVLKAGYSGVKAAARLEWGGPKLLANGSKTFKKSGRFADPDVLKMFDYQFIIGNPRMAMTAPRSVILTRSMAELLFGSTDVLNKALRFENKFDLKVTGVIEDLPKNSSTYFDFLMPWSLYETQADWVKQPQWTNNNWVTLVELNPEANVAQLNSSMSNLIKKNASDSRSTPFLYPFTRMHLYGTFANGKNTGGKIEQVRLFMGLALGILLIACINFMNMATAKSERRAKEVGIRKTIGATRQSLISQFLIESLVLTVLSEVLAIVLLELALPVFNNLLGIEMNISYSNPYVWFSITAIVVVTGLIAGSYPAFYLSSFNPGQILRKRRFKPQFFAINLRQVLVVVQFSFAVILIIATIVIYKQIQYIKNRPVGYEISKLVEMPQEGELEGKFELFKSQLLRSGAVTSVYQSSGSISFAGSSGWGMEWPGMSEGDKLTVFNQLATTYDFIKTTGVKLIQGRDFSKSFASDSAAVMLSKSAVKEMNLTNPVGKIIKYQGVDSHVVGVFEDFIWGSPYQSERPMIVAFNKDWAAMITMRLNPSHPATENIRKIESVAKEINPAYPVEISFVDQLYGEKLKSERILGILANLFGGLAIFISCLGLFGLAAYSSEQRTKEIGVRKVLGASIMSLVQLLSFSFLKMVLFSIVIAVPVAKYLMENWLRGYEFHTRLSWMLIVGAAVGTLAIALFTVTFQAMKAATANPVDALKYE